MVSGSHLKGVVMVTVSAVLWSTAGLFVRGIALDIWTLLAWRSLFACLSLGMMALLLGERRRSWASRLGWPIVAYAPVAAVSMVSYICSLRLTSVANVMLVYAAVPFIAAGIAYLVLGERSRREVLIASGVAMVGVIITAGAAVSMSDLIGNALALLMTVCFGATIVMARRWPDLDLTAATAIASALCGAVCWVFAAPGIPSASQLAMLFVFSLATQSAGYLFFLLGARRTSAAEAGFIGLLDVLLAPLWVWLAYDERPRLAALAGGSLILGAVIWYVTREEGRRPARPLTDAP